jgi:hypothetical protein
MGQTEKNSVRAYVFRVAPDKRTLTSGICAITAECEAALMGIMPSRAVRYSSRKPSRVAALPQFCPRELRHFRNDLVYTAGARRF